jgi:DtxR family Mn-dependent transcriptional regulator
MTGIKRKEHLMTEQLSESLENYLEAIFELEKTHKVARAKDIADKLNLQRGSVTGALKSLAGSGLINYEPYSFITLTPRGRKLAADIASRHRAIRNFLIKVLQIDAATAEETACRMEHVIDPKTFERLVCFINYVFTCPRAGEHWIRSFRRFCDSGRLDAEQCEACIQSIEVPDRF